jgi:hypothetical protein
MARPPPTVRCASRPAAAGRSCYSSSHRLIVAALRAGSDSACHVCDFGFVGGAVSCGAQSTWTLTACEVEWMTGCQEVTYGYLGVIGMLILIQLYTSKQQSARENHETCMRLLKDAFDVCEEGGTCKRASKPRARELTLRPCVHVAAAGDSTHTQRAAFAAGDALAKAAKQHPEVLRRGVGGMNVGVTEKDVEKTLELMDDDGNGYGDSSCSHAANAFVPL